jgi:hypothetical protein
VTRHMPSAKGQHEPGSDVNVISDSHDPQQNVRIARSLQRGRTRGVVFFRAVLDPSHGSPPGRSLGRVIFLEWFPLPKRLPPNRSENQEMCPIPRDAQRDGSHQDMGLGAPLIVLRFPEARGLSAFLLQRKGAPGTRLRSQWRERSISLRIPWVQSSIAQGRKKKNVRTERPIHNLRGARWSGKIYSMSGVKECLVQLGFEAFETKEPTSSQLGQFVKNAEEIYNGMVYACLIAADRYFHIEHEILPALAAHKVILCDRYVESSLVLQRIDSVDLDFIWSLNCRVRIPDLSVILAAGSDTIDRRLAQRSTYSRFERSKAHGLRNEGARCDNIQQ